MTGEYARINTCIVMTQEDDSLVHDSLMVGGGKRFIFFGFLSYDMMQTS